MPTTPSGSQQPRFGDLLRRHRVAQGLTQELLAERTGLSVRGISDLERGLRSSPQRETIERLTNALDLSDADQAALLAAARRAPRHAPQLGLPQAPRIRSVGFGRIPSIEDQTIGRANEISEILRIFSNSNCQILSLTGPPGVGKTRLAVDVAHQLNALVPDEVFFVDLTLIRSASLVLPAIGEALGLPETGASLLKQFSKKFMATHAVVILDNFEHVIEAAPIVAMLSESSTNLRTLVTSREPLRIHGERVLQVQPLTTPPLSARLSAWDLATSEAVSLFVSRARTVDPEFRLTNEKARLVAQLCIRLDGLPLAIELAAARARTISVETMLQRLNEHIPVLNSESRDIPARHRTLRDAISWSFALLREDEQSLICRLSVFLGGWTLESAEAVLGIEDDTDVFGGLASLRDKNLIVRSRGRGVRQRFTMLETIREFAVAELSARGDDLGARRSHATYFLKLAEVAEPKLTGPEQGEWFERLEDEYANLRSALEFFAKKGEIAAGLRLASALWWFWIVRGHLMEGRATLNALLAHPSDGHGSAIRAKALEAAANLAHWQGDFAKAQDFVTEALAIRYELNEPRGIASAMWAAANVAVSLAEYDQAEVRCQSCLALAEEIGDMRLVAESHNLLGMVAAARRDYAQSRGEFETALQLYRNLADDVRATRIQGNLGLVLLLEGDLDRARILYRETLESDHRTQNQLGMAWCFAGTAIVAASSGDLLEAARLFGSAESVREDVGQGIRPIVQAIYEPFINKVRNSLDQAAFDQAWAEGRALSLEAAVEKAFKILLQVVLFMVIPLM